MLRRKGALRSPKVSSTGFVTFLISSLYDLGYDGYDFNCKNHRCGGEVIKERLDHFCALFEWSLLFPRAKMFHQDDKISDHLPILILLEKRGTLYKRPLEMPL